MANNYITNNQREVIQARDSITGNVAYLTATNNKLDVNATFSASAIAIQDGANSAIKATVASLTNSKAIAVEIVDGSGNQITSFGGGTQYTNGSAQATPTGTVALGYDGANVRALKTGTDGTLKVDGSAVTQPVSIADTTASGSITSTQNVAITTNGQSTVGVQVTGSFTGTLLVEGTTDGSTWSPTTVVTLSNGTIQTSVTGPINGQVNVSGLSSLRIRGNTISVGTATVTLRASTGVSTIMLDNPLPTGSNVIGAVTQSGTWTVTANAGTNLNTSALALETGGNLATIATNTTNLNNISGSTAAVLPTKAIYVGVSDGTNLVAPRVNIGSDGAAASVYLGTMHGIFNGSTYDRLRSVGSVKGTTGTGALAAGALGFDGTNYQAIKTDTSGNVSVVGTGTFTTQAAQSGTWTVQPGNTQNTAPWLMAPSANTGATGFSLNYQSALTNTKVAVKASAGLLTGWHIYNPNTSVVYIQVFNVASASVTLGTTPPTFVIVVPANGWEDFSPTMPGIGMSTAITLAATTTASGSTAPTSTLIGTFWYI